MNIKRLVILIIFFVIPPLLWWWPYPLYSTIEVDISKLPKSAQEIVVGARNQLGSTLFYDPRYVELDFPDGDVNLIKGVCTDVVIRSLRYSKFDLQKEVHFDMKDNFSEYPKKWGLKSPDKNIDHRRVPNLEVFFKRKKWNLPITNDKSNYIPGDIVSWTFPNGRDHIGVVADRKNTKGVPLIIHNSIIGAQMENVLFKWKITGHFRPLLRN